MQTTDGLEYDNGKLAVLIGDGMASEADRLDAISILREALAGGCTSDFLWRLAGAAVWDGVAVARAMLSAPQQPAQPAARSVIAPSNHCSVGVCGSVCLRHPGQVLRLQQVSERQGGRKVRGGGGAAAHGPRDA